MNTINYNNVREEFPLSTETLAFALDISKMSYELARLGGGSYILRGCVNTNGNVWSDGIVVINGELLPFTGGNGTSASSIRIKEMDADVVANYDTFASVRITRYVEFGTNIGNVDTYLWGDFKQVKSLTEIVSEFATKTELQELSSLLKPVGDITMYPSATNIPTGHKLCNGATLLRADYPALFAVIGTAFGSTSDTNFKLPNISGRVAIGYNENTLNIPANVVDGKELNYAVVGNTGGKPDVTLTASQSGSPKHTHPVTSDLGGTSANIVQVGTRSNQSNNSSTAFRTLESDAINASDAHENRPPYIVLAYIIKVV